MKPEKHYQQAAKILKNIETEYDHLLHSNYDLLTMFRALEGDLISASSGNEEALGKITKHKDAIEELLSHIDEIAQDVQRIEEESPLCAEDASMEYYQLKQEMADFARRYLVNPSPKVA